MSFKKLKTSISVLFIIYLVYALICSVSIFRFHLPVGYAHENGQATERYLGEEMSQDRVVLLEDGSFAGLARINLIEQAKETIDIAYYSIDSGTMADTFLGGLVEAADRGVQVNIILDGLVNNPRGKLRDTIYAFAKHPNIELKLYEPLNLLRPWTWNNRLHDKLMMVDDKYAIIGGRNIGDKYFIKGKQETQVNDRDVLIINTKQAQVKNSVISDMNDYFDKLWTHDFTKQSVKKLSDRQKQTGVTQTELLLENLQQLKKTHPKAFNRIFDWNRMSISTKKITFIHNPVQRLSKEPWIWSEISSLMEEAEDSFTIESPYVIPTKKMLNYLGDISVPPENVTIITNSLESTPNLLAFSGYMRHSNKIVSNGFNVLEFEGPNSIHGKTYVFDDRISAIGSFNLDARSTFLSTESMVVIDSTELADLLNIEMRSSFPEDLGAAPFNRETEKESAPFMKILFLELLSKISPIYQHLL